MTQSLLHLLTEERALRTQLEKDLDALEDELNEFRAVKQNSIYTLRQKFSIIICVKGGKNIWLELIPVNKYFDTIVPIRCHGYGGNN